MGWFGTGKPSGAGYRLRHDLVCVVKIAAPEAATRGILCTEKNPELAPRVFATGTAVLHPPLLTLSLQLAAEEEHTTETLARIEGLMPVNVGVGWEERTMDVVAAAVAGCGHVRGWAVGTGKEDALSTRAKNPVNPEYLLWRCGFFADNCCVPNHVLYAAQEGEFPSGVGGRV